MFERPCVAARLSSSMVWRCSRRGRRPVPEHGASSRTASKLSEGNLQCKKLYLSEQPWWLAGQTYFDD